MGVGKGREGNQSLGNPCRYIGSLAILSIHSLAKKSSACHSPAVSGNVMLDLPTGPRLPNSSPLHNSLLQPQNKVDDSFHHL